MQVVPYVPQPAGGQYGQPESFNRRHPLQPQQRGAPQQQFGTPQYPTPIQPQPQAAAMHYGSPRQGYTGAGPQQPQAYPQVPAPQPPHAQPGAPVAGAMPGQHLTQQIFIPNDMVGAIIGKGGAKINESKFELFLGLLLTSN